MKIIVLKKPVWIGIIIGILLLVGAGIFWLFSPPKTDPAKILAETERADLQNLCLLALLKEDPEKEDYWQQLLNHYQLQGADPLTVYSTQQTAQEQTGKTFSLPEERGVFTPGAPLQSTAENGIAPNGKPLEKTFYAGVYDGEAVTYLAATDGIYASYQGLEVKLSPARAERMIPAQNGLYFINATQHRLQFISTDGSLITTLSALDAADFAFMGEDLYILSPDGTLYRNGTAIELPASGKRLAAAGETLFVALEKGIYSLAENTLIYQEKAGQLAAGGQELYFINGEGYPCRLANGTAEILKKSRALSLDIKENRLWFLQEKKNQLKKISLN